MELLNQSLLQDSCRKIAEISGSQILAFDVFYYYQQPREEQRHYAESYSFGDRAYAAAGGYLENFITKYGTLSRTAGAERFNKPIPSEDGIALNGDLTFEHHEYQWSDDSFRFARPKDIIEFLAAKNFGKHCFLTTVHQSATNIEVHFSTFVVLSTSSEDVTLNRTISDEIAWLMLSKFSNAIITLVSRKRDFYQDLLYYASIRTNRMSHVIGNIPIQASIAAVYLSLKDKDYENAMRNLQSLDNLEIIRSHATDLLCDIDPKSKRSSIHHEGITTYDAILMIFSNSLANPRSIDYSGINLINSHPANIIPLDNLASVFMLLWNIWTNWSKAHDASDVTYSPSLLVTSSTKHFSLKFTNAGVMAADLVLYMNDSHICANPSQGQGTTDIKEIAQSLPNVKVKYDVTDTTTSTTVIVSNLNHET